MNAQPSTSRRTAIAIAAILALGAAAAFFIVRGTEPAVAGTDSHSHAGEKKSSDAHSHGKEDTHAHGKGEAHGEQNEKHDHSHEKPAAEAEHDHDHDHAKKAQKSMKKACSSSMPLVPRWLV